MNHFVTHLEGAIDGARLPFGQLHGLHNGRPIWVRYDLAAIRNAATPGVIATRPPTLWRYRELLPLPFDVEPVTLGEGMSPLLPCPRLGESLGLQRLLVKDESQLPTGSFKSRGMTAAVSMAKWLGVKRLALPTAGNAGGAAAAYGARAGMEVFVFMPEDTPGVNQMEVMQFGAKAFKANGLINDCGKIVGSLKDVAGWFDLSTLKEPYRIEGKKTMGLELAEQLGWRLPDVILYPTGGGTGLIGMWKAFHELKELGWLKSDKMPRLVSCQAEGCAPIVRAFDKGERFAELFPNAHTAASGLRVPAAVGDFMMLDAIRASHGRAVAGRESAIQPWMIRSGSAEGISICPETAICFDVLERLIAEKWVKPEEEVVVFNTGAAQKYIEALLPDLPRVDKDGDVKGQIGV
ncbi:MAG TPA: threonine synthase [Gemmataceae bacterium]|jgi:threonine synthase|nr:threonine synthase [Gemmataceae bacterium]